MPCLRFLTIIAFIIQGAAPAVALPADLNNDQLAQMFGAAVECKLDELRDQISAEISRKSDAIQNQIVVEGTLIELKIRHAKNREVVCESLANELNR